jgi:hypothetical protein
MATATAAAAETETEDVADATSQIIIDSGDMKNNPVAPVEGNMNTSRRPRDLALLQQRMKAWQPLLSPRWVIAAYLVIAAVFIPVGECEDSAIVHLGYTIANSHQCPIQ